MDAGKLTLAQAEELTGSWIVKFSECVQLDSKHWEFDNMIAIDKNYDGGNLEEIDNVFSWETRKSVTSAPPQITGNRM